MCGRYAFSRIDKQLLERLCLDIDGLPEEWAPSWNIAPGQVASALLETSGQRRLERLHWGFPRPGAAAGSLLINARVETAAVLPAFREAFAARRCAIPCEGWYEWRLAGKARQPWYIQPAAGATALLAGLWMARATGDAAFVILTCPAAPSIVHLHERMPVVLDEALWNDWLSGDGDRDDWRRLQTPSSVGQLSFWPISLEVNRPTANHPGLILPVPQPQGDLF